MPTNTHEIQRLAHAETWNFSLDVLRDNDALIDGTDLFAKVRQQVRLNAEQSPQYQNIRMAGHEVGGDFLFVRRR